MRRFCACDARFFGSGGHILSEGHILRAVACYDCILAVLATESDDFDSESF